MCFILFPFILHVVFILCTRKSREPVLWYTIIPLHQSVVARLILTLAVDYLRPLSHLPYHLILRLTEVATPEGSAMPALRTPRRDVILRVPKMSARPSSSSSRPSTSAQNHDSNESGHSNRRSMSPTKRGPGGFKEAAATGKAEVEETSDGESYQYASQATSAAEWNSLLIWARRQRGPQWDAATGM